MRLQQRRLPEQVALGCGFVGIGTHADLLAGPPWSHQRGYDATMNRARVKAWSVWLVLLMAVLLPPRGWAMAAIPVWSAGPVGPAAPLVVAHAQQPHWQALLPCHGVGDAHAPGDGVDLHHEAPAGAEDGGTGLHACASCALCHSAVAVDALLAPLVALQLAEARGLLPARDTGRLLVATLERPPRR